MVLLSTQNICKKLLVRKYLQFYAENFCWSKPGFSIQKVNVTFDLWTLQKEEERLRASTKRESLKRRVRERAHAKGLSAGYLEGDEEDEEDEDISISAIKNKYKQTGKKGTGKFWPQTIKDWTTLSSMWKVTQNAYCSFHCPLHDEQKKCNCYFIKTFPSCATPSNCSNFDLFKVNIFEKVGLY